MKVSLILTTFNNENRLPLTLDSIEKQDYEDIEVIIKDGGSSDRTLEIAEDYAGRSKYSYFITRSDDKGIYDAMNQGIAFAKGEIIAPFNDQFVTENAVSKLVNAIECAPDVIGVHSDLVYTRDGKVVRYWKNGPQKSIYTGWMPGHPTLFLKRGVYDKYGLYDDSYIIAADYEFMVRFLSDKKVHNKLAYVPEVLVDMDYGGTSNKSFRSYIESLKEGHRALKQNGISPAFIIDCLRTLTVLRQFCRKK